MALTQKQVGIVTGIAETLYIPWDLALGLVDKESAGKAFYAVDGKQLPAIRIEGHHFYRRLGAWDKANGTNLQAKAVAAGLASPKVGAVKNSTTMAGRYSQFARMEEIHKDIATESISIGIGQVMGFNHRAAGYPTAVAMLQAATASFDNQVEQFLRFIASSPTALAAAQAYNYERLASFYNGSGWRKINPTYAKDLQAFTEAWSEGKSPATDWTARILALGFDDVRSFQKEKGLKVDGIVGPITKEAVTAAERAKKATQPANGKGVATAAAGAAAAGGAVAVESGAVENIGQAIEHNRYIIDALQGAAGAGTTILIVVAVALVAVGGFILIRNWQKKKAVVDAGSV